MQTHTQALTVKLYKTKAKGKTLKNKDSTTHLTIRQGLLIIFIRGNLIELSGVQNKKKNKKGATGPEGGDPGRKIGALFFLEKNSERYVSS